MARAFFKRDSLAVAALLLLTVALGAYFRFTGLGWDDYVQFHPDERFMTTFVGIQLGRDYLSFSDGNEAEQEAHCRAQYPDTNGVGGYFDARCSSMNPHNLGNGHYAYGTFPPFLAYWVASGLNALQQTDRYLSSEGFSLLMRGMSALYDTLVILVAFGIGLELRGKWTGLLAATIYTGAVLPIQIAHYATADGMASLWVALTLYQCLRIQREGGWLNYGLSGVFFGAALASRFNVAPLVLSIMIVSAVRMMPVLSGAVPHTLRWGEIRREFGGLVLAGLLTLLVFRIFNPYAFTGPGFFGLMPNERWIEDLGQARTETSPTNGAPPQWQWVGRVPYAFPFFNMVLWGMGVAFGAAAWTALVWCIVRIARGRAGALVTLPLVTWIAVYFAFVGGNFVSSMRYFLPLYAAFAGLAAYGLVGVVLWSQRRGARLPALRRGLAVGLTVAVTGFTLLWAGMFTNIYRNMATFTQAAHWVWETLPGDFAMQVDGAPAGTPLINIPLLNSIGVQNDNRSNATQIHASYAQISLFTPPVSGTVSTLQAPRIGDYLPDTGTTSLRVWVSDPTTQDVLTEVVLTDDFDYDSLRVGRAYNLPLDPPLTVEAGRIYQFNAQILEGGPLVTTGTVMAWEGAWDEPMPPQACTLPVGVTLAQNPPPGLLSPEECRKRNTTYTLLTSMQLDIVREDDEPKREDMLRVLNHADYLIIGTNRRYDSQSRIPERWPLTNRYYEALFGGELGYELVAEFQETFELGGLRVSDQHLPTYDSPQWLNEFEAEEAFHVYDHPAVFVFKKRADYNPIQTQQVLNAVPLTRPTFSSGDANGTLFGPVVWSVEAAHRAPTALTLPADLAAAQRLGGTWSERFDRDSAINTNAVVSVVGWYATVWLLGMVVWPVLFRAMPALSDRGYGLARYVGMTVIAFIAWALSGSAVLPMWSGGGLWLITGGLALLSLWVAIGNRAELAHFARTRWRLLLTTELLTVGLFALMLVVRLSNPDLWTVGYGGEKPMNVSMFNGVLRSSVFPPVDPWFAGGYINYYYFGYVIVGVPTLLLGVVPATAYNLILPTIFAAAGITAFGAAFTLVDAWRERTRDDLPAPARRPRLGNPYVAGVLALLMAVVLGNLDTPRVLQKGLARLGGYDDTITLQRFLENEATEASGGVPPTTEQYLAIAERAANPSFSDNLRYELAIGVDQWRNLFEGVRLWSQGATLPIGTDRWFWAPSRVIDESVGGRPITEMPFFTFVYGDLHAHMMTMPLILFVSAFVINEVLLAGREQRRWAWRMASIVLAGGVVGLLRAANTWDYPTYLVLGLAGLGYAVWMRWRVINRRFGLDVLVTLGAFVLAGVLAARPYTAWFATAYESLRLWEDAKTPLWAYWQIHGLFLFFIVSLLVWETGRWLRAVRVRDLRGRWPWLVGGLVLMLGVLAASVVLAILEYQVALIVLPLIAWIAALFFRPTQSPSMRLTLVLVGLALSLTLAVEIVVLDGDIGRQNTVFKFYIHVWMLFSVAAGAAGAWLIQAADGWRNRLALPWYTVGGLLFLTALAFPLTATVAKSNFRLSPQVGATLDGDAFMAATTTYYENYGQPLDMSLDYRVVTWLQDNVQGTPTILEGRTRLEEYYWGSRISIHTGLPSLVGWNFHQRQQRSIGGLDQLVWQRVANINHVYTTPDPLEAWRIIRAYDVAYIVVASIERANYGESGGLNKFEAMVSDGWLERALVHDGQTLIYRVVPEADPGIVLTAMR
ncbi:MAG: DUF2298 domain-containing protein [Anaerolineae bacterium]|nr:DUF2298 domain-containing protein [Anaerolineae bacterium]